MSRIGNRILSIPSGVTVEVNNGNVIVKNSKESLNVSYPSNLLKIEVAESNVKVIRLDETTESNMFQGTVNACLKNALIGLSEGFVKNLELKGVGYKAKLEGTKLNLALGFSHPVILDIPKTLKVEVPAATEIKISGASKEEVGQFAAVLRSYRKPEPYKGKGVLYKNEVIVRKVGKTADKKK